METLWQRFKDWYLGGDPNYDGHLMFTTIGWGPFPLPGERGRMQIIARRLDERFGKEDEK